MLYNGSNYYQLYTWRITIYKRTAIFISLIILLIFSACSKDNTINENTCVNDQTAEVNKNSQTYNQINIDYTAQISKLEELTKQTAEGWNPELAKSFYNYFYKTKQPALELEEIINKLEQEDH